LGGWEFPPWEPESPKHGCYGADDKGKVDVKSMVIACFCIGGGIGKTPVSKVP